jgi:hypothetical protein
MLCADCEGQEQEGEGRCEDARCGVRCAERAKSPVQALSVTARREPFPNNLRIRI